MDIKQVNEFLNLVVRALKPGGLFLFDICTEANSRKHFLNREEEGQGVGYRFKRKMRFDSHLMIQENHFNICLDHQPGVIYSEKHQQRIYRPGEMRKAITAAGFIILEETNGLIRKPPRHDSLRVHFLCRSD